MSTAYFCEIFLDKFLYATASSFKFFFCILFQANNDNLNSIIQIKSKNLRNCHICHYGVIHLISDFNNNKKNYQVLLFLLKFKIQNFLFHNSVDHFLHSSLLQSCDCQAKNSSIFQR